jgi:hypothetical protein
MVKAILDVNDIAQRFNSREAARLKCLEPGGARVAANQKTKDPGAAARPEPDRAAPYFVQYRDTCLPPVFHPPGRLLSSYPRSCDHANAGHLSVQTLRLSSTNTFYNLSCRHTICVYSANILTRPKNNKLTPVQHGFIEGAVQILARHFQRLLRPSIVVNLQSTISDILRLASERHNGELKPRPGKP